MIKKLVFGLTVFALEVVWACATCYGAPETQATLGMNGAIWTLLGITGGVLSGVVAGIISLRNKANSFLKTQQK